MKVGEIVGCIFIGLFLLTCIFGLIDSLYKYPQAADKANQMCQEQGYDFYEEFKRVRILSVEPVAVKCQYVSSYKDIDLNINKVGNFTTSK